TISAPEGAEIAKRTFNPKLGIEGGISILGTTGIVEPMSCDAAKESLSLELSMMKEKGSLRAVFVPGRYGKEFAVHNCGIDESRLISIGNYAGYMLEQAEYYGMTDILLVGHLGKFIKLAGGNFDLHSRVSDAKFEIIAANYILLGGKSDTAKKIMQCTTTEEACEYIDIDNFYPHICLRIRERCMEHLRGKVNIEAVIFSMEKGLLAQTDGAQHLASLLRCAL
ncbi:MAG: cobalt-precorrin-5B (C(1))-methyltransferase CbiD, partial [Spirochaetota bacterium]